MNKLKIILKILIQVIDLFIIDLQHNDPSLPRRLVQFERHPTAFWNKLNKLIESKPKIDFVTQIIQRVLQSSHQHASVSPRNNKSTKRPLSFQAPPVTAASLPATRGNNNAHKQRPQQQPQPQKHHCGGCPMWDTRQWVAIRVANCNSCGNACRWCVTLRWCEKDPTRAVHVVKIHDHQVKIFIVRLVHIMSTRWCGVRIVIGNIQIVKWWPMRLPTN